MATRSLSPNQITQRLLKHRSAVVTLARQAARKAVKRQLQAQGIKLYSLSMKEISTLADDYLAQHSARLVADAKQIIAASPLFASYRVGAELTTNAQKENEPKSTTSAVQMSGAK